jgi:hypothetical protein
MKKRTVVEGGNTNNNKSKSGKGKDEGDDA